MFNVSLKVFGGQNRIGESAYRSTSSPLSFSMMAASFSEDVGSLVIESVFAVEGEISR